MQEEDHQQFAVYLIAVRKALCYYNDKHLQIFEQERIMKSNVTFIPG